jgi:DJ-1 family protein
MKKKAVVCLAPGGEEMEIVISIDVLRRAGVDVMVAGVVDAQPVVCSRQVVITPDQALANLPTDMDVLVLPGGAEGTRQLSSSSRVQQLVQQREQEGLLVAAICAAPSLFAVHGFFRGYQMTCHPSVREQLEGHGVWKDSAVVRDRNLITSQGPGTSFLFALAIVRELLGAEKVQEISAPMMLSTT